MRARAFHQRDVILELVPRIYRRRDVKLRCKVGENPLRSEMPADPRDKPEDDVAPIFPALADEPKACGSYLLNFSS